MTGHFNNRSNFAESHLCEELNKALARYTDARIGIGPSIASAVELVASIKVPSATLTLGFTKESVNLLATIGGGLLGTSPEENPMSCLGFLLSVLFSETPTLQQAGAVLESIEMAVAESLPTKVADCTLQLNTSAEVAAIHVWSRSDLKRRWYDAITDRLRVAGEFGPATKIRLTVALRMEVALGLLYASVSSQDGVLRVAADAPSIRYMLSIEDCSGEQLSVFYCTPMRFSQTLLFQMQRLERNNVTEEHTVMETNTLSNSPTPCAGTTEESPFLSTNISVQVRLGNLEISIGELLTLTPGQLFEYRHNPDQGLKLTIGEECVAEAIFVEENSKTMLEIRTVPKSAESNSTDIENVEQQFTL